MAEKRVLTRLAKLCLALPETERRNMGRHASFHVRGKTFVSFLDDHHGDGIVGMCVKVDPGANAVLIAADPSRFYLPAYVGVRGWVGLRLDTAKVDWSEVKALVFDSYRRFAPKRLAMPAQPSASALANPGGSR